MEDYHYRVIEGTEVEVREIDRLLNEANHKVGFDWNPEALTIVMRDQEGNLLGGLLGKTIFGWLYISSLVVAKEAQGKGCGTKLMEMAEAAALARGCAFAHLDTFSFQARDFYEKLGYEVYGTLDNYPIGQKRYFLKKSLLS